MRNVQPRPFHRIACFYALLLLAVFVSNPAKSQDANYWSSNYGPGGFFTPGATIANTGDSGVFFFNPALLAWSRKNSASVSGTVYQFETYDIKNGVGAGLDLKSSGGSIIPQMVANTISLKGKHPFTIAYALTHEPVMNFQTTQRKDAKFNVLNDSYSPGPEYFLGQYNNQNLINNTTAVLSLGMPLSNTLAFGLTIEGILRKQTYSVVASSRAFVNDSRDTLYPPIVSSEQTSLATYTHVGIRLKAGVAWEADEHNHFGLLITSPLARLYSSATIVSDDEVNNLTVDSSFSIYLLASTRQTGLKAKWKMPLSIAFGYTHDFQDSRFFFTAEYFNSISQYNIVTPRNDYFIRPDTANNSSTSELLKISDAHKAILNLAFGFSHDFTEDLTGYCSFLTDFSYLGSTIPESLKEHITYTSQWDQYHSQLGINLKRRKLNLRAGLLLTFAATHNYTQPMNFDNPNEGNLLQGDPHLTSASHFAAGFLFSYIHNL